MNGFDLSTSSGIYIGGTLASAAYLGSTLVWSAAPPPIDYSTMPLTIESLEDNNTITIKSNGFSDTIIMIINVPQWGDMAFWIGTNTTTNIYTLNQGEKIQIKNGWPTTCTSSNYLTIGSSGTFNVYGNIMSVFGENNGSYITTLPSTYQFNRLFYNSKVVDTSNLILPATTLTNYCYYNMFYGCTSLITAPLLPVTTLANNCYYCMFYGCTSLTTAPELPATTLANYCYGFMFYGCTSLTTAPELPATTLAYDCYQYMFQNCTSLTTAPELPATTLANYCYEQMFQNCTSLTTAPELPATTLANNCYRQMFRGCTSLTAAPELPAITLVSNCYYYMFYGCTSLNYIKALFTTTPSTSYTDNWVYNVAASGTFIKSDSATWNVTGTYGVPSGWDAYSNENSEPFTIVSLSNNNTISIENTLGSSFTLYYNGNYKSISSSGTTTITTLNNKNIVRIIADTSSITRSSTKYITIKATGDFIVRGNIMSLLNAWSFITLTSVANYQFYNLFKDNTYLKDASGLILPATTINSYAYDSMFRGCTSLVKAPELPATLSTSYIYQYNHMFDGCTSLVKAPELPSTTLSAGCYNYMFKGCTSLVKAPDLLAATLKTGCYQGIFYGCTSLNYIKAMFTTTPSDNLNQYWVYNVASTGTFVKNANATWDEIGYNGVPSGWTIQTASS